MINRMTGLAALKSKLEMNNSGIKYTDRQESKFPEEIEDVKMLTFAVGLNKERNDNIRTYECSQNNESVLDENFQRKNLKNRIYNVGHICIIIFESIFHLNKSDATFGWMGFHNTFTVYFKHPEEPDLYTQVSLMKMIEKNNIKFYKK